MNDQYVSAQVARDLYYIHENRVDAYRQLLRDFSDMDLDMKAIIERMIEQGLKDKEGLKEYMKQEVNNAGETYKSWQVMLNPVTEGDKKTVLATLADDELIIMNTYSMAISLVTDKDLIAVLESQQEELKQLHAHIKEYHDAQ